MESQGGRIFRAGVWTPREPWGWQGRVEERARRWVARGSGSWAPGAAPAAAGLGQGAARAVGIPLAGAERRAGAQVPASEEWRPRNPLKWERGTRPRRHPGEEEEKELLGRRCRPWGVWSLVESYLERAKWARRRIITLPSCWPS